MACCVHRFQTSIRHHPQGGFLAAPPPHQHAHFFDLIHIKGSQLSKADDEYVLKDGAKTACAHPTRDDLTLLSNGAGALQNMLCRLDVYARKKHLIINTVKSEDQITARFVSEDTLPDKPHASSWLAKTYVIPAGMYASQARDTGSLKVKRTTTNWAALRECGHQPLQYHWFRAAVKL
eukprot:1142569-Pelagomonas_calceolata.AAC.1